MSARKVVVAHRGARDAYQVAHALQEAGMLDRLVTDLYWPADNWAGRTASRYLAPRWRNTLELRNNRGVPGARTESCVWSGLTSLALEKLPVPFSWRRQATRWADGVLGRRAGEAASERNSTLLSYSYYGHSAFQHYTREGRRILFQLHPHPASVRRILHRELAAHPDCAESLRKEWELSLPEWDFNKLVEEPLLADNWIAASSFTKQTLIENGIPGDRVHVVPYGVDLQQFRPASSGRKRPDDGPLRLLFVGTINQRKGIKYLLQALRLLGDRELELRVCGRVVDGLELFHSFGTQVKVTPSVSREELIAAYQSADLFVLPSVAEGFGQVLLEALACGLPILSTTRTAAPDLVTEGREGFVVEPGNAEALAQRIDWALNNRPALYAMREAARARAEYFTWARFRSSLVSAVRQCTEKNYEVSGAVPRHV